MMPGLDLAPFEALARVCEVARRDTGQSRRVADFLLAWHNAQENGGWDPADFWSVDAEIASDILTVLRLALDTHKYPGDLDFEPEIDAIWRLWRGSKPTTEK